MPSQILVSATQPKYWRVETPRDLPDTFRIDSGGVHVEASAAPLRGRLVAFPHTRHWNPAWTPPGALESSTGHPMSDW